ncbi:MAG TPA: hypothetical protein VL593_19785 [Ramlibacter sp.]|jgi:hypothetical protein|nr:hypothetical protein [Ramlibacter sp.]
MKSAHVVIGSAAICIAATVFGNSNDGYTDLGGGLVMRDDGTVIAAWDMPGCEAADDAFEAADVVAPDAGESRAIWRARYDRGW